MNKLGGCLAVIVIFIVIILILGISKDSSRQNEERNPDLNASVRFTGTQFIIKNNDSFDWSEVKLEVNGGLFSGGYELRVGRMTSGQSYTVGALQFAKSDGERLNPFRIKPKKFTISADTYKGRGFYYGEWN